MPTYGGSEQIQGIIRTPVGIFFACPNRGAVYVLGDKMEEISGVRMKTWFRDHLPLQLKKYAAVLDEHVQYDWSVGISLGYDPFHNRVLLHKKDYIPKFTVYTDGDTLVDGRIFFRNNGFYRYKARTIGENSPWVPVEFTNTSYFEDKSYTISFSLNSNA